MNFGGHRLSRTRECVALERKEKKGKLLMISFPYRSIRYLFILSSLAIKHAHFLLISLATDFLCVHLVTRKEYIFYVHSNVCLAPIEGHRVLNSTATILIGIS